jgi:diguanylate cyclase (GGDEF)-like protein
MASVEGEDPLPEIGWQQYSYFIVRYAQITIGSLYLYFVGLAPGLLTRGVVFCLIAAYAAVVTLFLTRALRQPVTESHYRQMRAVDYIAAATIMPQDPYATIPSAYLLLAIAVESAFRFGTRMYTESLVISVLIGIWVYFARSTINGAGFEAVAAYQALFMTASLIYTYLMVRRLDAYHEQLESQNRSDHLTGLLNRRGFLEAGGALLKRVLESGERLAVLYGDLDGFKQVNDTQGHDFGDLMLREIARIVPLSLRSYDVVARVGGDEFAILLPDTDIHSAESFAQHIQDSFNTLYVEHGVRIGISLGIAVAPRDGTDLDDLMEVADRSMYRAKAKLRKKAEAVDDSAAA